jgi:hypothetical protein
VETNPFGGKGPASDVVPQEEPADRAATALQEDGDRILSECGCERPDTRRAVSSSRTG